MGQIIQDPSQLDRIASTLETDAQSIKSELDAVNQIIQFLKTTHIAPRLERIYADWDQAYNSEFVNWDHLVRDFAGYLRTTAKNMKNAQIE